MSTVSKAHVLESLKGKIEGDLFTDLPRRLLYHTSASSNSVLPQGVIRPKTPVDVATTVDFCRERGIAVIPRGAGTGMAGSNLGDGVVLDFCRYMNRVLEMDVKGKRVLVEPGLIYGKLNERLLSDSLFFPPDPSSGAYCTIGGMVANNAAGAHTVKYGPTRDYLVSLEGVSSRGEILDFRSSNKKQGRVSSQTEATFEQVRVLLKENEKLIQNGYPQVSKNASGYLLQDVLHDGIFDLPKLLCGSEGSLALFTKIELALRELPPLRAVVFAAFASLEEAGRAVLIARELKPSALEIIDRSLIREILKTRTSVGEKLPPESEAALLIEAEASSERELDRELKAITEALSPLSLRTVQAKESKEQKKLWDLRRGAAVKAKRQDWKKPIRVIEDAAVPPARIADYIRGVRQILSKRDTEAILVGHAGNGNIHVEPLLDVTSPRLKETIQELAAEVSDLVRDLGGTLSGEHGDGIVRSPYLPKIYPELAPIFEEIKKILDPKGVLNPGVIVPYPKGRSLSSELRYGFESVKTGTVFDELRFEVERCFSCGVCRNYCPAYAESGEEESLPRARANLLRGMLAGLISPGELFASREAKNVFELCFNCGRCAPECPAGFDSARLATLAKGYFEQSQGLTPVERALTTPDLLGKALHETPKPLLSLMNKPALREWGAPLCGISGERPIPKLPEKTLRDYLKDWKFRRGGERGKVVYFPGCYAENHDPLGEGLATIFTLEENGFEVEVPQLECCGIAQLTTSGFSRIQDQAGRNIQFLLGAFRSGKKIVLSSPSCGHAFTEEYPYFEGSSEAKELASHCWDICRLLESLAEKGELKHPGSLPLRVAYHNPCHLRVRGLGPEAISLLGRIPGMELVELPDRCCGMAGTFGAKERHYERSMQIAAPQVQSVLKAQVRVVATGCGTCQIQMEHAAHLPAIHPVAFFARAYGAGFLPAL